ncbi:MAG: NblA/ycf18 family protein [Cyanobacteria bacterium P01_F01_bin.56]
MNEPTRLTLEQQFSVRSFEDTLRQMPPDQVQEFAVYLYQQMMLKDNAVKAYMKQEWGI